VQSLLRPVAVADRLALRRTIKKIPPWVGRPADLIGHAATGGRLWLGAAAGLAVLGPRGRRAATNGVAAYLATSALANGPAKWATQRNRPRGFLLADLPRMGRRPSTSSFPSAHTATAVAFATAASIELPLAAPVLLAPAAAVALARIQAVRHYPSDVLAGAALGGVVGIGSGLLLRRWRGRSAGDDVSEADDLVEPQAMLEETGWDAGALGS
jgi:undecaprenyl-diphosphatase